MQQPIENKDVFIISAFKSDLDNETNERRHESLKRNLRDSDIKFSENEGSFGGVKEKSVGIFETSRLAAHHYAGIYQQDCFLHLKPTHDYIHEAYLVDTETGKSEFIGYFRSMMEKDILALGLDYTIDKHGTHYTVWHTDTVSWVEFTKEIQEALEQKDFKVSEALLKRMEKHNAVR